VTHAEAVAFLETAVRGRDGSWLDLGAGEGTFTGALSSLLGPAARILAVDRDPAALRALERLARQSRPGGRVRVVRGDLNALPDVPGITDTPHDGALLANVLHCMPHPAPALAAVHALLRPGARIVVIEYERTVANPFVPHPLPPAALGRVAAAAGLGEPAIVERRPSRWQGGLYCATLDVPEESA